MYAAHRIPVVDSSAKSVEEMSTMIVQTLKNGNEGARPMNDPSPNVRWFADLGLADLEEVGGKNASLGEMVCNLADLGVRVPDGFATTADGVPPLHRRHRARRADRRPARRASTPTTYAASPRSARRSGPRSSAQEFPADLEADVRAAYDALVEEAGEESSFAVRSSATAEDLPDASFAGQQETFLNVRGIDGVLQAIREVFASLYNDRAIAYRVHHGFEHDDVALSAGVQRMVRSDIGASGVMFTMDTESGLRPTRCSSPRPTASARGSCRARSTRTSSTSTSPRSATGGRRCSSAGVGAKATKMVYTDDAEVGRTTEFVDVAPEDRRLLSLTDDEVEELARHALVIEEHYGRPMDIEWGKDGVDGQIYVLQARPETVQSRATGALERYKMPKESVAGAEVLVEGRAIGQKIGAGAVRVLDERRPDGRLPGGRGARRRHDRPRLGADHEAGRRDRDQPRRPDLPRRDHRPRARHPRRGRHRQRDPRPRRRPRGHRLAAPRATPGWSTRACSTSRSSAPSSTRCRTSR